MAMVLAGGIIPSPVEIVRGLVFLCFALGVIAVLLFLVAKALKVSFWWIAVAFFGLLLVVGTVFGKWRDAQRFDRCDSGDHRECALLGETLILSGDPTARAKGNAILRRECEQGQTGCCGQLAYFESLSKDPATVRLAREDYEKDCTGGSAYGCGKAGRMYLVGPGPRDVVAAARLLALACRGKDNLAAECADLADLYRRGEGVPRDPVRAAELNRRLCDVQGWDYRTEAACQALSEQYVSGEGVVKDEVMAAHYANRARHHGTTNLSFGSDDR
jgi:membrane protein implicated in regulation of membrane protease activity